MKAEIIFAILLISPLLIIFLLLLNCNHKETHYTLGRNKKSRVVWGTFCKNCGKCISEDHSSKFF